MITITNILDVEKHLDGIDAVIFDLDDTLYSEKEYVRSGFHAIADAFPEIPTMYNELWEVFEKKQPAIDVVFANHNISEQKEDALRIYRYHKPTIELYPGVRAMLNRIGQTRKLGIITDGRPEGQHAKLEVLGLTDIPYIITDELGGIEFRKPCEIAFILMCERLGIKYEKTVYVGDNIIKDFVAPERLNMQSIFIDNNDSILMMIGKDK